MPNTEQQSLEQLQAANLWDFIRQKNPHFSYDVALSVIQSLAPMPTEELKVLAKRLRKELQAQGVAMAHTAALGAVARIQGFPSWHQAKKDGQGKLRLNLISPTGDGLDIRECHDWDEARVALCEAAESWQKEEGANLFSVKLAKNVLALSTPVTTATDSGPSVQEHGLLFVSPIATDDHTWLEGAGRAVEGLRRRLEETGLATLDGVAVIAFCDSINDAVNSELVMNETEHELDVGFEVARGDEVECWAQLERLADETGGVEQVSLEPETGAWLVGNRRFTFDVATLRPNEFIPGLRTKSLSDNESRLLLRRYALMKRRASGRLPVRLVAKQFSFLSAPAVAYRVNLHRLLLELNKLNLTWDSYCAEAGVEQEMTPVLPLGFIMSVAARLNLADPNIVFARPNRSELSPATDLKLLRTLLPRVHHVRYRANGLDPAQREALAQAVEEVSSSIVARQMTATPGAFTEDQQIAHMAWAADADELVASLDASELEAYIGVMPFLKPIESSLMHQNLAPYAFGLSLFLDVTSAKGVV